MALSALRSAISLPYPVASPGHGFWGEQTSTLNFCEEVRKFGSEFWHLNFRSQLERLGSFSYANSLRLKGLCAIVVLC